MRILLLNQAFHPDIVATAQHLSGLAQVLAERGHQVTVLASRRRYDAPDIWFAAQEKWRGVRIYRVPGTGLGKGSRWRRALDFATFMVASITRLATLPRFDVVITLTSPPLISVVGACLARLHRSRFIYWVMDLNPDQAVAAGWLRPASLAGRILEGLSRFSLKRADRVIALDRFMRDRIAAKGIENRKVTVIPPWSMDDEVRFDAEERARFRKAHHLEGKFVVMHSGNHSPCHPLETLMKAAENLATEEDIAFCFIGGGSRFPEIARWASESGLRNVRCLPYQPLEQLRGSLSAADLHVVLMGNSFVGIVHPCKIYNILRVAAPVLCVGPRPCHVSDIFDELGESYPWSFTPHGQVDQLVQRIRLQRDALPPERHRLREASWRFSKQALLPQLVAAVEAERCA